MILPQEKLAPTQWNLRWTNLLKRRKKQTCESLCTLHTVLTKGGFANINKPKENPKITIDNNVSIGKDRSSIPWLFSSLWLLQTMGHKRWKKSFKTKRKYITKICSNERDCDVGRRWGRHFANTHNNPLLKWKEERNFLKAQLPVYSNW